MPITFLCGYCISKLKNSVFLSRYKSALKLNEDNISMVCYTANTDQYDASELVVLGYVFEYMAIGEIRSTFQRVFKKMEINCKMSDINYYNIRKRNLNGQHLILIGGPFHNSVSRQLLFEGNKGIPFKFDENANLIYEGSNGIVKRYCPEISNGDSKYFEKDYALIINVRNPLNKDKRIIALMGCRSIGCYGAAVFIARKFNSIIKKIEDDEYAIIISCEGEEENIISEPVFIDYFKLEYSDSNI